MNNSIKNYRTQLQAEYYIAERTLKRTVSFA